MSLDSMLTIDNLPFTILLVNVDGNIVDCLKQVNFITAFEHSELKGKSVFSLFPQLSKLFFNNYSEGALNLTLLNKSRRAIDCSLVINKQNEHFIFYIQQVAGLDSQYEPHVLNELLPARNTLEEAFWKWDLETRTVECSSQVMSILGYSPESFKGPTSFWKKNISPNGIAQIQSQFIQHLSGELPCINVTQLVETKNGEKKWIILIGKICEYKNGQAYKILGSVKDITDRHVISEQLAKQNNYLQLAEKVGNLGHWRYDLINKTLFWSKGVYCIHGVTAADYTPTLETAIKFYIPSERKKVNDHLQFAIRNKQGFHFKSKISQAFGRQLKVESIGEVEMNEVGDVISVFGVFKDIHESDIAYEKLKLLAMVNHTIKVPIFFIDDKDNVVYQDLSPQNHTRNTILFNYINFTVGEYLDLKQQANVEGQIKRKNISFDKFNSVYDLSVTYQKDEGIYIWIVNNVTEKFRAEQQQIISNRLALLGNTFGNVSHDINNVLGVALGATEMLELKYSQGKTDISEYIERVKNAIDKGKSVTERLLAFTRKPTIKVTLFDPIKEIENNKYLFKQLLLSTIDLSVTLDDISCEINFPQGEFTNILLNLVLNAQDAIRENGLNGKIEISANINKNSQLEVHVQDSGIGIEQENISKIFDPFYSSKSVNKGNGIGLANVYSTVYKHKGTIQVEGVGSLGGAHFTLVFDCVLVKDKKAKFIEKVPVLTILKKNILILDDEISIAQFVSLYLESEGCKTVYVNNRKELLESINQNQSFDIFLTDMILPDISGRQATQLVLAKYPKIQILSMSGYIEDDDDDWSYPVLRKPFNSKELKSFMKDNT